MPGAPMPGAGSRGDAPAHVGRYELLFRIAAGGMAEVFAGRVRGEAGFEKLVAVKRMLPHLADDPRFVDMFLDEARVAASVSSPNVVQTLDLGRDDRGALYLVLELCIGASLAGLLRGCERRREPMPLPIALEVLAQAAQGLDDAHEATTAAGAPLGIVHRDVSPHNLLVGVDGRTRVADFGIARALYRRSHTSTGELKGKFAYFSPEQARGEDVDRRADVFALGIVAWEAVTGAKLFAGDDALRTLRRVAEEEIPDPRSRRPDLPGEAAGAILRALLRDPRERWQTAGDMATALRNAARGLGPTPSARAIGRWVAEVGADRVRAIRDGIDVALGAADAAEEIDVEAEAPTHVSSGVAARSSPDTRSAAVPPGTAAAPKPRLALDSQPSVTETAGALVSPPPGKPAPARAAAVGIGAAVIVAAVFLLGRASREAAPGSGSAALPPSAEPVAAASASASSAPPASAPAAASSAVDPAAVGSGKPSTKPAGSARVAADARPSVDARAAPSAVAATSSAPAAPPPPTSAPAATQAPAPPPKPVDTPPQPGGPLLGDDAFTRDLSRKH